MNTELEKAMNKIQTFTENKLLIQVEEHEDQIKIFWIGESTSRNPAQFLDPILNENFKIIQTTFKRLILDFTKAEYMNSAAIIPIIKILKLAGDSGLNVQVFYNQFERWQSVLIGELRIFETEDDRIQVIGIPGGER
ncbi:MAG: hypothetical protein IPQ05_18065 [Leptospiraceae bacterium]|nr:hypothetical protein [Leptospiraceae bacterium]MBL0265714.1 hypothetical protein [Leptospiraceae bacterium]